MSIEIGCLIIEADFQQKNPRPRGSLELGSWGALDVLDWQTLSLRQPQKQARYIAVPGLLTEARRLYFAFSSREGRILLVEEEGDSVYLLDLTSAELKMIVHLERWAAEDERKYDPGGLYEILLIPINGGVLVSYECGVVFVDFVGGVRWSQKHHCFARFSDIRSDIIWYEGFDKDDRKHSWGYRIDDGQRVDVPLKQVTS